MQMVESVFEKQKIFGVKRCFQMQRKKPCNALGVGKRLPYKWM
jgi:hypothetical protein